MGKTLDSALLQGLPAWKGLEAARAQKLRLLEQAIQAKEASLRELAQEAPLNSAGGMVFGAGNESLDLEQQFTRIKEDIKSLQGEFARTIRMDTRIVQEPGKACYGSLIIARNLNAPARWDQRVFRLVLLNEQQDEQAEGIEHVELGSPLGLALLGIAQGEEFKLGLGAQAVRAEVEEVIEGIPWP